MERTQMPTGSEELYPASFFRSLDEGALRSAEIVVPLVMDLVHPRSVIDVGCGTGAWPSVFIAHGVPDVMGVDGDYVDRTQLRIPQDRFIAHDLEERLTLDRRFDLVTSLEVAEHLSPEAAEHFVDSLVSLGPVVLFSAAVPGQGGQHHVNERWPSYWADLFAERGYVAIDCLRDSIWDDEGVDWWYAQNLILYARSTHAHNDPRLADELRLYGGSPPSRVHPRPEMIARAMARRAAADIDRILSPVDMCVVIGRDGLPEGFSPTCSTVPFMEENRVYRGPPVDSDQAIEELEPLLESGATHLVLTWSCFWWRDFYEGFFAHLLERFDVIETTEAVIVFHRRPRPPF